MKSALISFLMLFVFTSAFSKTIVISDIDDTIKMTHVNMPFYEKLELIRNANRTNNSFWGMSTAYQELAKALRDVDFYYVSSSPSFMSKRYSEFLQASEFPNGKLVQKDSLFGDGVQFKLDQITAIIEDVHPDQIILIGDIGESDPEIYREIASRFPGISMKTFIHYVYSSDTSRLTQQTAFVTAFDLVMSWVNEKWLKKDLIESSAQAMLAQLQNEDPSEDPNSPQVFPDWLNCNGFFIAKASGDSDAIKSAKLVLQQRCSRE